MNVEYAFVINLDSRADRLRQIQKDFQDTSIKNKLTRWNAIYGKELAEETIKRVTSKTCNYICSPGMIGCWLSHYTLWQYIARNNLDNVLILEDDAVPAADFDKKLAKILPQIPTDYDLVYLGCFGSCDTVGNKDLYVRKRKVVDLFIPTMPLGLHGYMLSNKGARKLVQYEELKKVRYHIDFALFYYIYNNDKDFDVYAVKDSIITQASNISSSDILVDEHPLVNKVLDKIPVTRNSNMAHVMNTQLFAVRHADIRITWFIILFAVVALLVGIYGSDDTVMRYFYFWCGLYVAELLMSKTPSLFELFIHISFVYVGRKFLRKY